MLCFAHNTRICIQITTGNAYIGKSKFIYRKIKKKQLMRNDRLCKLSEHQLTSRVSNADSGLTR